MPALRSLPFAASVTQTNEHDWAWFIRTDIASPVGTKRWTNHWLGTKTVDVGDGAGSQAWTAADVKVSGLSQNATDILTVAALDFANLDYTWTNWANSPGLRGTAVYIWRGWFNSSGAFVGAFTPWRGEMDNQEHGTRSKIALKPFGLQWERSTPWQTLEQLDTAFNVLMPSREENIYRPGGNITPPYAV